MNQFIRWAEQIGKIDLEDRSGMPGMSPEVILNTKYKMNYQSVGPEGQVLPNVKDLGSMSFKELAKVLDLGKPMIMGKIVALDAVNRASKKKYIVKVLNMDKSEFEIIKDRI